MNNLIELAVYDFYYLSRDKFKKYIETEDINNILSLIIKYYKNHTRDEWHEDKLNKQINYLVSIGADVQMHDNYLLKNFYSIKNRKHFIYHGANIKVLSKEDQLKYKNIKTRIYKIKMYLLLDFHYKRETEFSKNILADYNILSIVFSFC